jgi:hypothetical protein
VAPKRKPLSAATKKSLKEKAEKSKFFYGELAAVIRFGAQGADTKRPRKGESAADKAKRASFKKRHAKNIAKGKTSAAFWADKVKWS